MRLKPNNKPTPPDVIERIRNMRRNGIRVVDVAKKFRVSTYVVSTYAKGMHKEKAHHEI